MRVQQLQSDEVGDDGDGVDALLTLANLWICGGVKVVMVYRQGQHQMRCDVWRWVGVKGCGRGCDGMTKLALVVCGVQRCVRTCAAYRAPSDHQIREAALVGCGCRMESAGRMVSRRRDCEVSPLFSFSSYTNQTRLTKYRTIVYPNNMQCATNEMSAT